MILRQLVHLLCIFSWSNMFSSKLKLETWECSVTEGWSADLKDMVLVREGISFKSKSKVQKSSA